MNVDDGFNSAVDLFCFEWIKDERKIDWYHLDVIRIDFGG